MHIASEARLHELGIELPEQLPVIGSYRLAKRHRDIVYIAGHVSLRLDHSDLIRGKVGADLTVEEAYEAARVFAQAAGRVEKDAALAPRNAQDLRARYEDCAVTLVRKAVELRPPGQRAAFLTDVVAKDSALTPIGSSPGFQRIFREYGTAKDQ